MTRIISPKNTIQLPPDYQYHSSMDYSNNKKILYGLQVSLIAIIGLLIGLAYLLDFPMKNSWSTIVTILVTIAMAGVYLIIHELTHGVAAQLLSGVKPTYGIKLPYLSTGSPAYFNRQSFMIIALAPVVIWGIILIAALFLLPPDFFKSVYIVMSINFAGASGDIYLAVSLLKLSPTALLQDKSGTEPKVFLPTN